MHERSQETRKMKYFSYFCTTSATLLSEFESILLENQKFKNWIKTNVDTETSPEAWFWIFTKSKHSHTIFDTEYMWNNFEFSPGL